MEETAGNLIRGLRQQLGMTQEEFALEIAVRWDRQPLGERPQRAEQARPEGDPGTRVRARPHRGSDRTPGCGLPCLEGSEMMRQGGIWSAGPLVHQVPCA